LTEVTGTFELIEPRLIDKRKGKGEKRGRERRRRRGRAYGDPMEIRVQTWLLVNLEMGKKCLFVFRSSQLKFVTLYRPRSDCFVLHLLLCSLSDSLHYDSLSLKQLQQLRALTLSPFKIKFTSSSSHHFLPFQLNPPSRPHIRL